MDAPVLPGNLPFHGKPLPGSLIRLEGLEGEGSSALEEALATWAAAGNQVGSITRRAQAGLVLGEMENDESDFVEGGIDRGTLLGNWLGSAMDPDLARGLACQLGLEDRLGQGIRFLSTGELRKAMICHHLADSPAIFAAEDMLEGLDRNSRLVLPSMLARADEGIALMVFWGDEVEGNFTRQTLESLARDRGWQFHLSPRLPTGPETCPEPEKSASQDRSITDSSLGEVYSLSPGCRGDSGPAESPGRPEILVRMKDVNVTWDDMPVLKDFSWELKEGEHTFIQGPNGCGKTSLLRLITGENPQVFSNHVELFGYLRGSGETVWDIRRNLGLVSHRFHMDCLWHADYSCLELVVSGFHDSIGLYERPGETEVFRGRKWLEMLGMEALAQSAFRDLDWGRQRMLLVARALVKQPRLLILDEPCQGLSPPDREVFLGLLESIAHLHGSTVLHVSHDPTECLGFYRFLLESAGKGKKWTLKELA